VGNRPHRDPLIERYLIPLYAYVEANPSCPYCGAPLTDLIAFQWGYLPDYQPCDEHIYRLGDVIQWRLCQGAIPTWTFFDPPSQFAREPCNAGDPRVTDLFARDMQQDHWLTGPCPRCSAKMGGAIIEIRAGRLVSARVYRDGEIALPPGDLVSISATGELVPIAEPPMRFRSDCGEPTFWRAGDGVPVVS
jgi:hypothetical protein